MKKGYFLQVKVCHNVPQQITVTVGDATVYVNRTKITVPWSVVPKPLTIAAPSAGQTEVCQVVDLGIDSQGNNPDVSLWARATYTWANSSYSGTGAIVMCAPDTPKCDNCKNPPPTNPSYDCGPEPRPS